MKILYCDGKRFKRAFLAGASWLSENKEILNRLNVFPVPDGDTGTNMSLTLLSAVDELKQINGATLKDMVEAAARATLMGARGCSGVIFSQLVAGFARVAEDKAKLNSRDIAEGLQAGATRAYQAVTTPTEGTILTVIRESAEEAVKFAQENDDIVELLEAVLNRAKISLKNTPNLLPILSQAGVVDSGGQGYVYMLEGMLRLVYGDALKSISDDSDILMEGAAQAKVSQTWDNPYCTEFLLMDGQSEKSAIRSSLESLGEELVVIGWNELIRVHIHTSDPEQVLAIAHSFGNPTNLKIDDTRKQHRHLIHTPLKIQDMEPEISIITTAPGVGIKAILMSLGAEYVVMSEQARNPSVSELVEAIDKAYSENVLLLPNEGNILPASSQAAGMSKKNVQIIPSKNVSQGISSILAFNPKSDISKNAENMKSSLNSVKHGEIARAVRDANYGNLKVKENDIIGLYNSNVHIAEDNYISAVINLLKVMIEDDNEIITILYGSDFTKKEAEGILAKVETEFPEKEFEIHYGGQSYCSYIISVE